MFGSLRNIFKRRKKKIEPKSLDLAIKEYKETIGIDLKEYKNALESDLKDATAHNNLGNRYRAQGKLDLAIKEYEEAVRIDPNHAEAHGNLGFTYPKRGDYQKAIKSLERFIEVAPTQYASQVRMAEETIHKLKQMLKKEKRGRNKRGQENGFIELIETIEPYTGKTYDSLEEVEKAEQELMEKIKPFIVHEESGEGKKKKRK